MLDGFHCNCLRKILAVKPSYISRVSNARVRAAAQRRPLSVDIRRSQLKLMGEVLREPSKSVLKDVAFQPQTVAPLTEMWVRRVGRPRQEWTTQLMNLMKRAAETHAGWNAAAASREMWMKLVESVCQ